MWWNEKWFWHVGYSIISRRDALKFNILADYDTVTISVNLILPRRCFENDPGCLSFRQCQVGTATNNTYMTAVTRQRKMIRVDVTDLSPTDLMRWRHCGFKSFNLQNEIPNIIHFVFKWNTLMHANVKQLFEGKVIIWEAWIYANWQILRQND